MSESTEKATTNTTTNATASDSGAEKTTSVVDTLFDLGTEWAAFGLQAGKSALEQSAKTLAKAADTLDRLARQLGDKDKAA